MRITLIDVPYDSGRHAERMGRGAAVLAASLPQALATAGHDVESRAARLPPGFVAEVAAVVGLQRIVRAEVAAARQAGRLPVVLSGNCGYAALGATAGLGPGTAVLWLDAHADFNTPETSPSGFFDGTSLAALCGRAWTGVARTFASFTPVPEASVVLLGARDLDDEERTMLVASAVSWVRPSDLRDGPAALAAALDGITDGAERLYVHLDLDVIDPADLRANVYSCPGGLTVDAVVAAIAAAGKRLPIAAVGITAYDPQLDVAGRGPAVASRLVHAVVAASSALPA